MEGIGGLFWIFIIFSMLQPWWAQRRVEAQRMRLIRVLERRRKSRVIVLVHRQEQLGFLGIPIFRFVNIEDSEEVLRAIRLTDDTVPIDLVLHTPGGLVLAADQIARAVADHPAKVTVFVPHWAMSGGTLIAMAADEIVMDPHAVLGPVDPQLNNRAAASILAVVDQKPPERIDDATLMDADLARKALSQVRATVTALLEPRIGPERAAAVVEELATGKYTHDHAVTIERVREFGLPVSDALPGLVHQLMELYPQPKRRTPSVEYVPLPYRSARSLPDASEDRSAP